MSGGVVHRWWWWVERLHTSYHSPLTTHHTVDWDPLLQITPGFNNAALLEVFQARREEGRERRALVRCKVWIDAQFEICYEQCKLLLLCNLLDRLEGVTLAVSSNTDGHQQHYHRHLSLCPKSRILTFTFIELIHYGAFYSDKHQSII